MNRSKKYIKQVEASQKTLSNHFDFLKDQYGEREAAIHQKKSQHAFNNEVAETFLREILKKINLNAPCNFLITRDIDGGANGYQIQFRGVLYSLYVDRPYGRIYVSKFVKGWRKERSGYVTIGNSFIEYHGLGAKALVKRFGSWNHRELDSINAKNENISKTA